MPCRRERCGKYVRGWNGSGRDTGRTLNIKILKKGKEYGKKRNQIKASYVPCGGICGRNRDIGKCPLPVKAAGEGNYTVTFEAGEGTCETESISVQKGESLTLPEAAFEGYYLESWVDITENDGVTKFTAVGRAGDTYTPERDLWLYANWKPDQDQESEPEITVTYEARIGDTNYEKLEAAFDNAQAGDTIIVLKDCSVSKTLEVTADNVTLKSEDAENPVTISREEEFTGKSYAKDAGNVLVGISSGSLATQDIIFDGGAVLDENFNNSGQVWDSPLIYVKGSYAMEAGTVLQNNYNTDYSESVDGNRSVRTAGAVNVAWDAGMTMYGGLIQDCYTLGRAVASSPQRPQRLQSRPAQSATVLLYGVGRWVLWDLPKRPTWN